MLETIDQSTDNFQEKIGRAHAGMKRFNIQITEIDKEVNPVEWRLTNQIQDVKSDLKDDIKSVL